MVFRHRWDEKISTFGGSEDYTESESQRLQTSRNLYANHMYAIYSPKVSFANILILL